MSCRLIIPYQWVSSKKCRQVIYFLPQKVGNNTKRCTALKYSGIHEYNYEKPPSKNKSCAGKWMWQDYWVIEGLRKCSWIVPPCLFHPAFVYLLTDQTHLWSAAHLCWTSLIYCKIAPAGWLFWMKHRNSPPCIIKTMWGSYFIGLACCCFRCLNGIFTGVFLCR